MELSLSDNLVYYDSGHWPTKETRDRRPGCLSIEVERADPSGIMTYSEADPEADMQNIFFLTQARFINPKFYPKRILVSGKLICDKTAVNTILHFGLYMPSTSLIRPCKPIFPIKTSSGKARGRCYTVYCLLSTVDVDC